MGAYAVCGIAKNKHGTKKDAIEQRAIACDKVSLHIGIIKSLTEITISSFHEDLLEGTIQTMWRSRRRWMKRRRRRKMMKRRRLSVAGWTRFNKNGDPNDEIYSDT